MRVEHEKLAANTVAACRRPVMTIPAEASSDNRGVVGIEVAVEVSSKPATADPSIAASPSHRHGSRSIKRHHGSKPCSDEICHLEEATPKQSTFGL